MVPVTTTNTYMNFPRPGEGRTPVALNRAEVISRGENTYELETYG